MPNSTLSMPIKKRKNTSPKRVQPVAASAGARSQTFKERGDREADEAKRRIDAAYQRVEAQLLSALCKEFSGAKGLLDGWTVHFDLQRVTGDPEGVQRGYRLNYKDKSILYVAPDCGQSFSSRQEVAAYLNILPDEPEEEESPPAAPVKPQWEPPPVETDAGELAFEVDRIIDVRRDAKGHREFLVRWVGYSAADDSWEPEASFLDLEPVIAFEAKRPYLQPREESIWRREQQLGPEHQAALPEWQGPLASATSASPSRGAKRGGRKPNRKASLAGPEDGMVPLRAADTLIESAQQTAALLTAAAFGPTSHRCYVAPTDCDLGLFARIDIPAGTPICEYAGPMLPREWQQQSGYNLGIPGGDGGVGGADRAFFIDGASEQAPFVDDGRSLGTYANHSSLAPNAGYRWRVAEKRMPHALSGALWIEALEPIAANTEIRVNYEAEGRQGQYWSALGIEPSEGDWKAVKMPPLPPTCHGLEDVEGFEGSLSPLPWEGARGGDERLRVLVRTLAPHCTYPVSGAIRPELLGVVATHIPGRSALECYRRWCQLMCAEGAGGKAKRGGAGANGTDRAALADGSLAALLPEAGACFCGTKRHLPSSGLDFNGLLVIGEKIKAQYGGRIESLTGQWFNGWVATLHDDGTCDVHYTDGDKEEGVPRRRLKVFVSAEVADRIAAKEALRQAATDERNAKLAQRLAEKEAAKAAIAAERQTRLDEKQAARQAAKEAAAAERAAKRAAEDAVLIKWLPLGDIGELRRVSVGERVQGKYQGCDGGVNWFEGVVTAVHGSGSCAIAYDDGDVEDDVAPRYVKVYITKAEYAAFLAAKRLAKDAGQVSLPPPEVESVAPKPSPPAIEKLPVAPSGGRSPGRSPRLAKDAGQVPLPPREVQSVAPKRSPPAIEKLPKRKSDDSAAKAPSGGRSPGRSPARSPGRSSAVRACELKLNDRCEAFDLTRGWCKGSIVEVRAVSGKGQELKVHFDGRHDSHDEWIAPSGVRRADEAEEGAPGQPRSKADDASKANATFEADAALAAAMAAESLVAPNGGRRTTRVSRGGNGEAEPPAKRSRPESAATSELDGVS